MWANVDADAHDSRQIKDLVWLDRDGCAAYGMHCLAVSWAVKDMDLSRPDEELGMIPRYLPTALVGQGGDRLAALLVKRGLWVVAEDGWQVVNFARDQQAEYRRARIAQTAAATAARRAQRNDDRDDQRNDGRNDGRANGQTSVQELRSKKTTEPIGSVGGALTKNRGKRLPEDWQPGADLIAWASAKYPGVDQDTETIKFRNYWLAKSGQSATKIDWGRTWQNWIIRASEIGGSRRDLDTTVAGGMSLVAKLTEQQGRRDQP